MAGFRSQCPIPGLFNNDRTHFFSMHYLSTQCVSGLFWEPRTNMETRQYKDSAGSWVGPSRSGRGGVVASQGRWPLI